MMQRQVIALLATLLLSACGYKISPEDHAKLPKVGEQVTCIVQEKNRLKCATKNKFEFLVTQDIVGMGNHPFCGANDIIFVPTKE